MPAEFSAGSCGVVVQLVKQQAGDQQNSGGEDQRDEVGRLITMFEPAGERVKPSSSPYAFDRYTHYNPMLLDLGNGLGLHGNNFLGQTGVGQSLDLILPIRQHPV